ncbi:lactococcin 972 family bacteriocin [Lacticaseibacillus zeae]|uniref:Bacteriocin n=3 Tax=Lacticaseibacillus TaxID=2759736 RepID=A0A0R1EM71_LACZE|nr:MULTISPECIES: lactococcin 972 family bacteriocin [Lacticaseibacillus]OFR98959.1 hypothetical protein HMPREF2861_05190 [Lactobacillus sp. HMSC068F07]OLS06297.1 hypothetical protein AUQ39_10535 [Lacticaseibacillus casei]KRK09998.1 hypothetical protein FD51_GL001932 [Lacticaseibacillus zeae DSM 20178 = KCTC 3804]MDE3314425.1 lactococcin 972 family bacteriocin [Lacticaseibacillus zeae]QVI32418.1 hypothetical protein KG087_01885 [Lacticaseibacillus zeae]
MKKIGLMFLVMGLFASLAAIPSLVSATTIDLPETAPNSGYVALDDNDNVTATSSPVLTELVTKQGTSKRKPRAAVNMANSRWVYYTDHNNYFNGYKWAHSNYYHRTEYHSSTAAVDGKDTTTRYADARKWSQATAAGKGEPQFWYWAPYN